MRTRLRAMAFGLASAMALASIPAAGAGEGGSLHALPAAWVADSGEPAKLADWKGRKVVLAMFYGSCHGSCPMIVQKLRKVEALFAGKGIDASFVLVSFDPSKDTPRALRAYRARTGLDSPDWTLLSGTSRDVRRLAMVLGIKYRRNDSTGEIMHDNKIVLLREDGTVIRRLQGLSDPEDELLP